MERSPDAAPDRYRAPALDKGLDILELLAGQSEGLTRAEIVKAMGRSPSEIYRMLERLVARNFVARTAGGDRYALTMKLFVLAMGHPPLRRLVAQAQPLMDAFAREALQSCHLAVPDQGAALVIAQASPVEVWEFRVRVGARLGLIETGSGQTLLAFQDPARRAETLALWGATGIGTEVAALEDRLAATRAQGCRIGESGQLLGVQDISVPVLTARGEAFAVLTCPFIGRPAPHEGETVPQVVARLRTLAAQISFG
ncbi:IclR family transcriptional regulator [Rubellimicrobium roseum]|uniref:IclR family transcriptional regulator n=2 Tax=Rubellimicrobium roseum TaxID=687525 RepID=A0A5C4NMC2_9RHOB|nr:IclR family transcriptional regulator [Rubellimicrobium roseum]